MGMNGIWVLEGEWGEWDLGPGRGIERFEWDLGPGRRIEGME